MFAENLKNIRKSRGLTQNELAVRLNVVRQTVSKWEKGLSVPDAEMLIRMSDLLEIPVSELLGSKIEIETDSNEIAEQLSRINEQLAVKNRRWNLALKIVIGVIAGVIVVNILLVTLSMVTFNSYKNSGAVTITEKTEIVEP